MEDERRCVILEEERESGEDHSLQNDMLIVRGRCPD